MNVMAPKARHAFPFLALLFAAEIGNLFFLNSLIGSGGDLLVNYGFVWGYLPPGAAEVVWIPDLAFSFHLLVFVSLFLARFFRKDREIRVRMGTMTMWILPILVLNVLDVLFQQLAGQWGNFWYVPRVEFFLWVRTRGIQVFRFPDLSAAALTGITLWFLFLLGKKKKPASSDSGADQE